MNIAHALTVLAHLQKQQDAMLKIVTIDFETHFSDEYSLKKITTEAYIRDPRFEVLGLGVRNEHGKFSWLPGPDVRRWLSERDWSDTAVLCHHTHFDGLILAHHFQVRPKVWLDTLSMARLMLGSHRLLGLDALAKHFELPEKVVPYDRYKHKRYADIDPALMQALGEGCLHDCRLTFEIFALLMKDFPLKAIRLIDLTIRLFTEPKLLGDASILAEAQKEELERKQALFCELGVTAKDLGSNAIFARLLAAEGIEMEFKDGKNGPIPATAKTDEFMLCLLGSANERIGTLAEARVAAKSSIGYTRAGRLLDMAGRGPLTVPLTFAGAHTTRWSGFGGLVNFQNFPRGGAIRRAIRAPPGHVIVKVDARSQECRILNTLAGQASVTNAFRGGRDVYREMASSIYGREIKPEEKTERFVGKIAELAAGFGCSGLRLFAQMRAMGVPGATEELGLRAVAAYRRTHPEVVRLWRLADDILLMLGRPSHASAPSALALPVTVQGRRIILPNGFPMLYELKWDDSLIDQGERPGWQRKVRNGWRRIYGSMLVENICQALGAVAIGQSVIRIKDKTGFLPVLLEHDAGHWVVPESEVDQVMPVLVEEVARAPEWLADAPMDAEGHYGEHLL